MLTEKTPPQPRFRIWDVARHHKSRTTGTLTVVGIQWEPCASKYRIELISESTGDKAWWIEDNFDLVSRPGLEPQPQPPVKQEDPWRGMKYELEHTERAQSEPQPPAETLQQKVARLKQEAMTCDDKSWLGKFAEWKAAAAGLEVAAPQAQSNPNEMVQLTQLLESLVERVVTLDKRLGALEFKLLPAPRPIFYDQWVKPVVIGTACASDNKDG